MRSHDDPDIGVLMHAAGDVRNGFKFEVKRSHDFRVTGTRPTKRIPLQWVGKEYFDVKAMFNCGKYKTDHMPACVFEASAHKVKAPEKTLKAVDDKISFNHGQLSIILAIQNIFCRASVLEAPKIDSMVSLY